MATLAEIDDAVKTAQSAGCNNIALLKCTSTYPASANNCNIMTIPNMRDTFGCDVGLSDHTLGVGVAVAAVALGACIIEKHLTIARADGGVDSAFSLEPHEFHNLRVETLRAYQSIGNVRYGGTQDEEKSRIFRRSIYITKDMKAGDKLTSDNLRIIRPGYGMEPKFYANILGKKLATNVEAGTPVTWENIL
jgi:N-acetylneuraminate synthase